MSYQKKLLPDGSPNPFHIPDVRKRSGDRSKEKRTGDRHKNNGDRHTNNEDRHQANSDRHSDKHRFKKDTFIAIDGEGITREDGQHDYVLLMASTGEKIVDINGLSTQECFNFLLQLSNKYPDGIFVCYGASYDVNMWLRDASKEVLEELWEKNDNNSKRLATDWYAKDRKRYSLTYWPQKSFTVRLFDKAMPFTLKTVKKDGKPVEKWLPNFEASVTIWDALSFFQARFVDALESYFSEYLHTERIGGIPHEIITWPDGFLLDLTHMKQMKNNRRSFTLAQLEQEIIPYCHDEVIALVRLMERLRDYLGEAKIELSRWDGTGTCAATLLRQEGVKEHLQEVIPEKESYRAQLKAYSAGRLELGQFGVYIGKVFNYDLHSAFPSVMPELPSLTNGMWRKVKGKSNKLYSLTYVKWSFDWTLPYFPFFWRDKNGSIYYPYEGEGWYYKPEIDAALKAFQEGKLSTENYTGKIEILESWEFQPYSDYDGTRKLDRSIR